MLCYERSFFNLRARRRKRKGGGFQLGFSFFHNVMIMGEAYGSEAMYLLG